MAYPRSSTPRTHQRLQLQILNGSNINSGPPSCTSTPSLCYSSPLSTTSDSLFVQDEQGAEIFASDTDFSPARPSSILDMASSVENPTSQITPQLNPYAVSFAPGQDSAVEHASSSRSTSPVVPAPRPKSSVARAQAKWGKLPFWHAFFEPGARATRQVTIESYARSLVSCKTWDLEDGTCHISASNVV